jgi:cytochrome c55X
MHRWAIVLVFNLGALASAAPPDAERQAELRHMLLQDCGSCHGLTLKGGLGPPLLPQNLEGKPAWFLVQTILDGRLGTAMPPWRPLLSEADAEWLVEQLITGETVQ